MYFLIAYHREIVILDAIIAEEEDRLEIFLTIFLFSSSSIVLIKCSNDIKKNDRPSF